MLNYILWIIKFNVSVSNSNSVDTDAAVSVCRRVGQVSAGEWQAWTIPSPQPELAPGTALPAETRDLSVLDARLGPGSRRMMAKVVLPVVPVFSFLWFEDKVTRYLDNTHYFCICTTMSRMIVWEWPVSRVPRHGVYMCGCHHRRRVGRRLNMGPELVC